ncbi:GNAT family N-acetyltransferase [Cryptosporangium japonicum]|uniref:Ribosomal protein S5-alanine N-acetyltransferase n=1 Tax=Cryptosporangium japonicum TaxID=80872 RepID=A0ABN0V963_9ACTN
MSVTRRLQIEDASELAAVLAANRRFLAPWWPNRPDRYFTAEGQRAAVADALEQQAAGSSVPLLIQDREVIVGAITVQSIIRGAFQSCSVGYWLAENAQGRGLATAALRDAVAVAFGDLRLHRMQAETLVRNERSHRVLRRVGFTEYGTAPSYLHIEGRWQEHLLFQLLTPTPDQVVTG